jgi:hypothetical protein
VFNFYSDKSDFFSLSFAVFSLNFAVKSYWIIAGGANVNEPDFGFTADC